MFLCEQPFPHGLYSIKDLPPDNDVGRCLAQCPIALTGPHGHAALASQLSLGNVSAKDRFRVVVARVLRILWHGPTPDAAIADERTH